MLTIGISKAEIHEEAQGAGNLDISTGISSAKTHASSSGRGSMGTHSEPWEHTQDEKYPTDPCRNLTLPQLLICEVFSMSTFTAKSDSEITKI